MAKQKKPFAAAAASLVLASTFGATAFTLAQGNDGFDPSNFQQVYSQNQPNLQEAFQASLTDANSQANRNDDGNNQNDDAEKKNEEHPTSADLPQQETSGTTAFRVSDGEAESGLMVETENGDGAKSATGEIIAPVLQPDNSNGNGASDNSSNSNNANNQDKPNTGGNGNSNSGSNQGGYESLPQDPVPSKESDADGMMTVGTAVKGSDPSTTKKAILRKSAFAATCLAAPRTCTADKSLIPGRCSARSS